MTEKKRVIFCFSDNFSGCFLRTLGRVSQLTLHQIRMYLFKQPKRKSPFPAANPKFIHHISAICTLICLIVLPEIALSEATAQWFITDDVSEDSIGSYTLTQNSEVNTVYAELINGLYIARFDGSGSNNGATNDGTPPNGDHPYLYRSGTLLGSDDGTVAFWMKVTEERSSGLFYERAESWGHLQVARWSDDQMTVSYGVNEYNKAQATVTGVNSWTHIAAVHTNDNTLRFYVNGSLVDTGTDGVPGSASATVIGSTRDGSQYFVGDMHDYRVWVGVGLTDQQIEDVYNEKVAILSSGCWATDDELTYSNVTHNNTQVHEACVEISYGPNYTVGPDGNVTAIAPLINLGPNTTINGIFSAQTTGQ